MAGRDDLREWWQRTSAVRGRLAPIPPDPPGAPESPSLFWFRNPLGAATGITAGEACRFLHATREHLTSSSWTSCILEALFVLGRVCEEKGDTVRAIDSYEKLLESDPGNLEIEQRIDFLAGGRPR